MNAIFYSDFSVKFAANFSTKSENKLQQLKQNKQITSKH